MRLFSVTGCRSLFGDFLYEQKVTKESHREMVFRLPFDSFRGGRRTNSDCSYTTYALYASQRLGSGHKLGHA